jgi:hypothetical protein
VSPPREYVSSVDFECSVERIAGVGKKVNIALLRGRERGKGLKEEKELALFIAFL